MAHTHTKLLYHVVFSTKERASLLYPELMERLAMFVGGVVRERRGCLLGMNGTENHVHLLVGLPPTIALSDQVRDIKALSKVGSRTRCQT